jgi:hypothetical protein
VLLDPVPDFGIRQGPFQDLLVPFDRHAFLRDGPRHLVGCRQLHLLLIILLPFRLSPFAFCLLPFAFCLYHPHHFNAKSDET